MKNKIIMFVLFVGLLINPVYGDTGLFNFFGGAVTEWDYNYGAGTAVNRWIRSIVICDVTALKELQQISFESSSTGFSGSKTSYYEEVNFIIDSNNVGYGFFGYSKNLAQTHVTVYLVIMELNLTGLSGEKEMIFNPVTHLTFSGNNHNIYNSVPHDSNKAYFILNSPTHPGTTYIPACPTNPTNMNVVTEYAFSVPYNYSNDGMYKLEVYRNSTYPLKIKIEINNNIVLNETSLNTETLQWTDLNILNNTWIITAVNSYDDEVIKTLSFGIPSYEPTLTTDKIYYNTSELIEISYTNIDVIYDECTSSLCNEPYQLWIYALNTPNIPKFRQWLYSDRRDETFTLNTSILTPQTEYQLMITSGKNNIVISSDIFYVYPDDEYLSISCDANANCITANKAKNTFYYKINNNSNIIVKDNDNNIISTYYNIIGTGSIIYTIPDDLEHINTYPNWKVYLNNTEYSTSFNKEMVVYWSLFVTPTPTPTFTPQPTPDINISDEIDNLKDEISPIKDLIIGLSGILIDNPDYNKDNIVDENEINHWFNSLIPMCIIFLLLVLYIGLKKQRE